MKRHLSIGCAVCFIRNTRCEKPGARARCILDTKARLKHTSSPEPFRTPLRSDPVPESKSPVMPPGRAGAAPFRRAVASRGENGRHVTQEAIFCNCRTHPRSSSSSSSSSSSYTTSWAAHFAAQEILTSFNYAWTGDRIAQATTGPKP